MFRKLLQFLIGIIFTSLGNVLMVKANLGQSTVAAMTYNLSLVTDIKMGYINTMLCFIMVAIQFFLLKKSFKAKRLLQLITGYIQGIATNFFMYDLFITANLKIDSYSYNLFLFIIAFVIFSFGVSLVMKSDFISFPIESTCEVLSEKTKLDFVIYRTGSDVLFVGIAIIVMLFIGNTNAIREGTIINVLLGGMVLQYFNKLYDKVKNKSYVNELS